MKIFYYIFSGLLVLLLGFYLVQNVILQKDSIDKQSVAWETYTSEEGFSFRHPDGYTASETKDGDDVMVFIVEADEKGEPLENRPPIMQINVSDNSISFALWEGRPWEGFPKIVETFESN
jgi:hypothetical protein